MVSSTGSGFVTVEFALPTGGTHKQRAVYDGNYTSPSPLIVAARKGCKRRGIDVANVIRITRNQ